MKKGSVLIESLLFLILSFILFLIINSAFSSLMNNQRQIEKGSVELSQIISISNLSYDDLSLIDAGGIDEYKSTITGETFRIGDN
ncbi:hypothetical protein [Athalassotoga saccharophila]|uniref:hypothetical protein n=1 Tax=Athalassotoga saccharophila TaxID=1441386 RepID=UPI00137A9DB8|nr:hypothetical protein [Athalassotoga saccharophila]BBJ27867.1 hypothetical protein ATHSA_0759 [Athalassotoga saccharophila]